MIDIPPDIAIRSTIRPGSVYYFPDESLHSPESHFFIVINLNPIDDIALILVCSSSKVEKVKKRSRLCPPITLVEINPSDYEDFDMLSIIDCNYIFEKTISQLIEKLSQGKLYIKREMNLNLVKRLREGVLSSNQVERRIKQMLMGNEL